MLNNVDISVQKTVYDNNQYKTVIDREFRTFIKPLVDPQKITVDEFFLAYEDLYLEIPIEGEIGSHEYLVKKSSELFKMEDDFELIQPLLDEIASLREQLLEANRTNFELQSKIALDKN